ncbi:MAG: hypothetical protein M1834_004578 [Cirrosporium novae-zelandiae]|nr:MAG: hypothetical protein M1834_004578 [Cirrosporium novae-zelandiae]
MAPETSQPRGSMPSLYANLLDPDASTSIPGTISRAPVVFKHDSPSVGGDASDKKQISAAALRFQPTKRPQLQNQKAKPKHVLPPKLPSPENDASNPNAPTTSNALPVPTGKATTLADWTAHDSPDDYFEESTRRQRGGRKRRKKNKEEAPHVQDWDDIYDPSRPNNYEEYKHSDEKIREIREWKDRLYAHRLARRSRSETKSDSEDEDRYRPGFKNSGYNFAPPASFAPPVSYDSPPKDSPPPPPPPAPAVEIPDDPTGEDAYARRLRMTQISAQPPPPPPPPPSTTITDPNATISRAPVRYNLPPAPAEIPATESELHALSESQPQDDTPSAPQEVEADAEEAPRSNRPGQAGFAERLLRKYGWTSGTGLGANNTGIVTPLAAKVTKQKKKPDSEGGGFATPSGMGKIVGGKKKKGAEAEEGKFGKMSEVVILKGMVDGMDLDAEMRGEGGGLMQEIGEECADKYGNVERVYIHRDGGEEDAEGRKTGTPVFVRFTSQLSALRAVNALEGRIFNGNTIQARFFDSEKFEKGIYE